VTNGNSTTVFFVDSCDFENVYIRLLRYCDKSLVIKFKLMKTDVIFVSCHIGL